MKKDKFNKQAEIALTIFLPLGALFVSVLIVLSFVFSKPSFKQEPLKPIITDGEFKGDENIAYFNNRVVGTPEKPIIEKEEHVLSAKDTDKEKWIEIDLSRQMLLAHEGDEIVDEFFISSGKWGRTPTGEFKIWSKLKYTLMAGGSKALNTYYYLPNVPYTQYFYQGYGIHGTYWHNNFGHPMSHGCINMYTPDAEKLFYWSNPTVDKNQWTAYPSGGSPGTRVVIHGQAPLN